MRKHAHRSKKGDQTRDHTAARRRLLVSLLYPLLSARKHCIHRWCCCAGTVRGPSAPASLPSLLSLHPRLASTLLLIARRILLLFRQYSCLPHSLSCSPFPSSPLPFRSLPFPSSSRSSSPLYFILSLTRLAEDRLDFSFASPANDGHRQGGREGKQENKLGRIRPGRSPGQRTRSRAEPENYKETRP